MNVNGNKDLKLVMMFFGIVSIILLITMIIEFNYIDFVYFCGVCIFAIRYTLISKKKEF